MGGQAEVSVGYFKIQKWVPKDQQHLTAELHGGLTDPADVAAAAKVRGAHRLEGVNLNAVDLRTGSFFTRCTVLL